MPEGPERIRRERRRAGLVFALWGVLVVAATAYAAQWPTDNRAARWVAQLGDDAGWEVLVERFGGDEFVLVRLEGLSLRDESEREALAALRDELESQPAVSLCVDARSLAAAMPAGGGESLEALAGTELVGALDLVEPGTGRYDLVLSVDAGSSTAERAELVAAIERASERVPEHGWRLRAAGHPLVAAALDEEARAVERRFAPALGLVAAVAAALFLGSPVLALAALLPAAFASAAPRAVLRGLGVDSDLILVALGPLGFVLLLASTLHLVSAYARHRRILPPPLARRAALREKLAAGLFAAATTAVGFGAFLTSALGSVAVLGVAVAVTMLLAVPLAFLLVPPLLGPFDGVRAGRRCVALPWRRLALGARRRRGPVIAAAGALTAFGAFAAASLPSETNALHYFPRGHPARADFLEIEAAGTGLSTVDVLVRAEERWKAAELREAGLDGELASLSGVQGVIGPELFAAAFEEGEPGGLALPLPAFLALAGRLGDEGRWARWTVRFATVEAAPTRALVELVRARAEAWASGSAADGGGAREVVVAGSVPAMLAMQEELVGTLATSLALTVLVTTACFALIAGSLRSMLAAVATNLLPVAAALGAARILSIPLDGATVMVAAVVLGLAVDNTFHLLYAGRGGGDRARLRAFDSVGQAAFVSSLSLALGFGALALSGFAPTARFGLLCAIGALAALVADLVVLPALWVEGRRPAPR